MMQSTRKTALELSSTSDLSGQHIVITGASSGIGLELTRVLVLRGAKVVMACRDKMKTLAIIEALYEKLDQKKGSLVFEECDLSSLKSVEAFCNRMIGKGLKIDKIFMNGGVFAVPYQLTEENLEYTYVANYLGHYLMLRKFLSANIFADDAHVLATMSEGGYKYAFARANIDMLLEPQNANQVMRFLSRYTASPNSKVMMLLMMMHFNHTFKTQYAPNMRFNCADPGPTLTDNINQMGWLLKITAPLYTSWFMHSVEVGAANLMWLASSKDAASIDNALIHKELKQAKIPDRSKNPALMAKIWQLSQEIIESKGISLN